MIGTIGEIRLFSGDYAPIHWAFCYGQLLPINPYQALYSILGTVYGGNGVSNFALPDCRGRIAVGTGQGIQLLPYYLGLTGGHETVTLDKSNLPNHNHIVSGTVTIPCFAANGNSDSPNDAYPALFEGKNMYKTFDDNFYMADMQYNLSTNERGMSNPVNIIQPVLGLTYIICIAGLYPEHP